MNQIINQRIEMIRRGDVPEGYKKTKVGTVPVEWSTLALSKLLQFKNGINADSSKFGKGVKLISVNDILSEQPIFYDTIRGTVDIDPKTLEKYSVTYGDILFQRSSENYEDAGTSNAYLDSERMATFGGFVIRGKRVADYDPIYFNSLLRTSGVRKEIIRRAAGAQHINIGQDSLSVVQVNIATKQEQQKIAEILTTCDKVIMLKEKLIAEKQRQKKYLMQQLLTGQKRLDGFTGKWEKKTLKDICNIVNGGTPDTDNEDCWNGDILWCTPTDITACKTKYILNTAKRITKFGLESSSATILPPGTILLCSRATIGESRIAARSISTNQGFKSLIPNHDINNEWLYYLIAILKVQMYRLSYGSTFLEISKSDLAEITIMVPCAEEQAVMANILSAADQEIELLQKDLALWQQKKKALMQLLLTGIVRVTV